MGKNKKQQKQDVAEGSAADQVVDGEIARAAEEAKIEEELQPTPMAEAAKKAANDDAAHKPKLTRKDSKFHLQAADDKGEQPLYRPEFGQEGRAANERIWELMSSYIGSDQKSIQRSIVNHVEYTLARTRFNFDNLGAYQAASHSVRDRLIEGFNDTQQYHTVSAQPPK